MYSRHPTDSEGSLLGMAEQRITPPVPAEERTLAEHYLHVLDAIAQRRARIAAADNEEQSRAAVLIAPARAAGATVDAIAQALRVSKPMVYELTRKRGLPQHLTLLVLSRLGAAGGLTT